jgi:L-ascorbate metabolism protein UlaG (beta-lactamase superfamily)
MTIMAIEILWLGRTCFRIKGREGTVITDPVPADSGYKMGKANGDVVTLSQRDDPAFSAVDLLAGKHRVLDAPGDYEVGGVLVSGIGLRQPGGERMMAFVFELEGVKVGHLGAWKFEGKPTIPDELESVDVLLLPVGGGPSLTGRQAADLMTTIDPSVVIPMFYKTDQEKMDLDPLDTFLGEAGTRPEPQPRFTTTKSGLPENLTVTVLQPRTV